MQSRLLDEAGFEPIGTDGWRRLAQKAVGEADLDQALGSVSADGIAIRPLYPRAEALTFAARARSEPFWSVVQRVDDPDPTRANRQARDDVRGGADCLAIVFQGAPNAFGYGLPATADALSAALDGIALDRTALRIDVHPASRQSVDWMVELLGKRKHDARKLTLAFGIDPAATFAASGRLRMSIEALKASMPQSLAHFFAMGVPGVLLEADGRVYHNAGATEAQELGAALAAAVSHLRMFEEARQALIYAAPHIGFALAVDQDQVMGMAKLRALRRLWSKVLEGCGIAAEPCSIHAETSWRMLTRLDPETNILRNTIAAVAAATGGADTISILAHTTAHGLPAAFARRVARNTQAILSREAHVGFVEDPAAGSGAVEALTEALCEQAWQEFAAIEAEGGILESLAAGALQARIAKSREALLQAVRDGGRPIVGTTLYPLKAERPVETLTAERVDMPTDGAVFCEPLRMAALGDAGAEAGEGVAA